MINIKDNIQFDDTKTLQNQSSEFQQWLNENCLTKINDLYDVEYYDEYDRPLYYTFTVDNFNVKINPQYLFKDKSSWTISGYKIEIN